MVLQQYWNYIKNLIFTCKMKCEQFYLICKIKGEQIFQVIVTELENGRTVTFYIDNFIEILMALMLVILLFSYCDLEFINDVSVTILGKQNEKIIITRHNYAGVSIIVVNVLTVITCTFLIFCTMLHKNLQDPIDDIRQLNKFHVILILLICSIICTTLTSIVYSCKSTGCFYFVTPLYLTPIIITAIIFIIGCIMFTTLIIMIACHNRDYQKESCENTKHIKTIEYFGEQPTCRICLEDYIFKEPLKLLECSHIFHENCISKWFNKSNKCPICKKCTFL